MGQGVETRVPFLDLALVRLAMRLPIELKVRDSQDKWILRHAFADILPDYVRQRPKNPLSHSSGLHERVRLYRSQFPRIYRSFGYDLHSVRCGGISRSCSSNMTWTWTGHCGTSIPSLTTRWPTTHATWLEPSAGTPSARCGGEAVTPAEPPSPARIGAAAGSDYCYSVVRRKNQEANGAATARITTDQIRAASTGCCIGQA